MAGIVTEVPFPTYPHGFPPEVVEAFTGITGRPPLGNVPAWDRDY
jgi:phosphopentomutase